jgi:hypothetical protein
MRKGYLLSWAMLLALCAGFLSCDKEEDLGSASDLVGMWLRVSESSRYYDDNTNKYDSKSWELDMEDLLEELEKDGYSSLKEAADAGVFGDYEGVIVLIFKKDGTGDWIREEDRGDERFEWSYKDGVLSLTYEDDWIDVDTNRAKVSKLTSSELAFEWRDGKEYDKIGFKKIK